MQWNSDQLEVSSPGGLPEGIRLDNLLVAAPNPRSPLLADAFKRTGLVERTGRGINRMFADASSHALQRGHAAGNRASTCVDDGVGTGVGSRR